jgi:ammonia channel protein AmtB
LLILSLLYRFLPAALVGSIVVGPRLGRFDGKQGKPTEFAPSSPVFQTLGVFILWLGW